MTDELFAQITARVDSENNQETQAAAFVGAQQNPEEVASASRLASRVGVPVDFAKDPELRPYLEERDRRDTVQQRLQSMAPSARKWLLQAPENLGMAHDDLGSLDGVGRAFIRQAERDRIRQVNEQKGAGFLTNLVAPANRGFWVGLVGRPLSSAAEIMGAVTGSIEDLIRPDSRDLEERLRDAGSRWTSEREASTLGGTIAAGVDKADRFISQGVRETPSVRVLNPRTGKTFTNADAFKDPWLYANILTENAPQLALQMVTGIRAFNAARAGGATVEEASRTAARISGSQEGVQIFGDEYDNARSKGLGVARAGATALAITGPSVMVSQGIPGTKIEGGLEGVFFKKMAESAEAMPGAKGRAARALFGSAKEGLEEGIQENLSIAGQLTYDPTAGDAWKERNILAVTGGSTLGAGSGLLVGARTFEHHGSTPQDTRAFLGDLVTAAKDSRLNQRYPEKFAEAVQAQAPDGAKEIMIPAERFFQTVDEAGQDPIALAEKLGVSNLSEALETGTDVIVPVGEYASQIAPTALHEKLAEDIRMNPGDMTPREEREAAKLSIEEAQSVNDEAGVLQNQAELADLPTPEIEKFKEATKQAIMAGNVPESEAQALAELRTKAVSVFVESGDITAEQALEMWPLTVTAYQVGEDPRRSIRDTVLDRLRTVGDTVQRFFQRGNGRYATAQEKKSARMRRLALSSQASMDKARLEARNQEEAEFQAFEEGVKDVQAGDVFSDKRGFVQFGDNQSIHIGLLQGRNLSTVLHEFSHTFLEMVGDIAELPNASERTKALWSDTLKELGVESREQIKTEHHEKFAKWGERYFMEGKPPSEKMRPLMQRFKAWMTLVYRQLDRLGVRMNDRVRSIFDRILATDEELEAQRKRQAPRLFASAADMGVSEAEFRVYLDLAGKEVERASEAATAEMLQETQRAEMEAWKEEKAAIRAEVEASVDSRQDMQALAKLQEPNGEVKINQAALQERYGKEETRNIPTVKEGGMDAESAAVLLGFGSGDELVRSLREAPGREELIENLADEIMLARHGDKMLDGSVVDVVTTAINNDIKAERIAMELRAFSRLKSAADRVGRVRERESRNAEREADLGIPSARDARAQARGIIEGLSLRQMEPNKYRIAGERYSRLAYDLKGKGDYRGAASAKTRELLNHFMFLEARKAREAGEAAYTFIRRYSKKSVRERIAKGGGEKGQRVYLDQIDNLLERFEFNRATNRELDQRQSLADFAMQKAREGELVAIDPMLYADRPKNYRDMTPVELQAVVDAFKSIETMARNSYEFINNGRRVTFEEAKAQLIAGAMKNVEMRPRPLDPKTRSMVDTGVSAAKSANTAIIKFEQVIDDLDGGDINGAFRRYVFEPICLAQYREFDLNEKITSAMAKAMETMPKDQRKSMLDTFDIPELGTVTRAYIFSMALNMGNPSNKAKMLEGMHWNTPEKLGAVGEALGKLNRADWEAVQHIWDTLGSLWPEIEALELRRTGIAPKRVDIEPLSMNLPDGSTIRLPGGYYPVVYDPARSGAGARQADTDIMTSEGGWNGPITSTGHTKERVEFSAPLLLDFETVLTRHLNRVIKDLSHREAAMSIAKLIMDQDVRDAIIQTKGPEYEAMFLPWLKGTVNDVDGVVSPELSVWRKIALGARTNLVLGTLAFRASSVLVQITDFGRLTVGEHRVGPGYLAEALASFTRHPQETLKVVREKSGEMRGRAENLDRDLRAMFRRVQGKDGVIATAQQWGMKGLAVADMIVSVTGWLGSYNQAISKGHGETEACAMADRTVRFKLMTGAPKDLIALQRAGDLGLKLATMYMGDLVANYGIINQSVGNLSHRKKAFASSFAIVMAGVVIPVLGSIIKGWMKGDLPDDEEEWKRWLYRKAAFSLPSTMPIVRDVAQAIDSGRDTQFTPLATAINRLVVRPAQMLTSDQDIEWDEFTGTMLESVGTMAGAPAGQASITGGYLYDIYTGEEDPGSTGEFVKKALFGKSAR